MQIAENLKQANAQSILEELKSIKESLQGDNPRDTLADKMEVVAKAVKKRSITRASDVDGAVSKSLEQTIHKSLSELSREMAAKMKPDFSMEGLLSKMGVNPGSGLIGSALQKRQDKKNYVNDMMEMNPRLASNKKFGGDEKALKKYLEDQFEEANRLRKQQARVEEKLDALRSRGWSKEQLDKSAPGKERVRLVKQLGKIDPRFGHDKKAEQGDESPQEKQHEDKMQMAASQKVMVQIETNTRDIKKILEKDRADERKKPDTSGGIFSTLGKILVALGALTGISAMLGLIRNAVLGLGSLLAGGVKKLLPSSIPHKDAGKDKSGPKGNKATTIKSVGDWFKSNKALFKKGAAVAGRLSVPGAAITTAITGAHYLGKDGGAEKLRENTGMSGGFRDMLDKPPTGPEKQNLQRMEKAEEPRPPLLMEKPDAAATSLELLKKSSDVKNLYNQSRNSQANYVSAPTTNVDASSHNAAVVPPSSRNNNISLHEYYKSRMNAM